MMETEIGMCLEKMDKNGMGRKVYENRKGMKKKL
jgi:hypothetical protein